MLSNCLNRENNNLNEVLCIFIYALLVSATFFMPVNRVNAAEANKDIYFWFEVNEKSYLEKYIKYAPEWLSVGKPIMTSTTYNVESFTKQLIDANLNVISGFKTAGVFTNDRVFHDVSSWEEMASLARRVSILTSGRAVILENEGTVKKMLEKGITSINYDELLKSISAQEWPDIWFYYGPVGAGEPVRSMSYTIARAVMNGIPNARLVDVSSVAYLKSPADSISQSNLSRTLELDSNPISIIYLDDDRYNFWKLNDADKAVNLAAGNSVIIYPGFGDVEKSSMVVQGLDVLSAPSNLHSK